MMLLIDVISSRFSAEMIWLKIQSLVRLYFSSVFASPSSGSPVATITRLSASRPTVVLYW